MISKNTHTFEDLLEIIKDYAEHVDMSKEGRLCIICGRKTRIGRVNRKGYWACLDCDYDDGFTPSYVRGT